MPKVPTGFGAALPEDEYLHNNQRIVYLPERTTFGNINTPSRDKPKKRIRGARRDVINRVALAYYLLDTGKFFSHRKAADECRTTTKAMNDYKDLIEVKQQIEFWKTHPDDAIHFRSNLKKSRSQKKFTNS